MKGIAPTAGWVILGLLLLVSFGLDLNNNAHGGAIDLRNRITGIRLLEHGIDAYHYKWQEPEPDIYCDPYNNPLLPVSKTTATPALLLAHLPLAPLPYRIAQMLWFFTQWLLLLGTAWLWLRHCTTSRQRWLVALAVVGFTYTSAWRLHAERGQAYVLLLFLFALWLNATLDPKRSNSFMAGFIAGILVALRPPFLLLAPFLVLHRRGQLLGAAAGLLFGLGLPMFWNAHAWSDYFAAMQTQSELYRNQVERHFQQAYPPKVEGIPTDILGHFEVIPYADFSIHALFQSLGWEHSWLGDEAIPAWPPLVAVTVPFAFWLCFSRGRRTKELLPGLVAWFFLVDLFLPAYRNSYNDVLILNLIALGIIAADKLPWAIWPCLLALPLGWAVYGGVSELPWLISLGVAPDQAWLINLPTFFFTVGAILFILLSGHVVKAVKKLQGRIS